MRHIADKDGQTAGGAILQMIAEIRAERDTLAAIKAGDRDTMFRALDKVAAQIKALT